MAATLATLDGILKDYYVGPIRDQIAEEANVLSMFDSRSVSWMGRRAIVPLRTSRNSGVGAVAEAGTLPTAGQQGFEDLNITAKFAYGRFQLTGPSIAASRGGKGAFESVLVSELDRLVEDVANVKNQWAVHGGAVLGFVWQKQNAATFEYAGRISTTELPLQVGNATDTAQLVRLDTYAAVGAATRVNAVTESAITFNAAINTGGVPAGVVMAVVAPAGSTLIGGVANQWANEPNGITSNLAADSLYGVSKAATSELRSNFLLIDPANDVYAPLDTSRMQAALSALEVQGVKPDVILTHPATKAAYVDTLVGVNQANLYVGTGEKNKSGDAGFTSLGYADIPLMTSRHAHKGTMYFVRKKDWGNYELQKGKWMDADGAILRRISNTDAYEGTWTSYYETVCTRPNAQAVLTGIEF